MLTQSNKIDFKGQKIFAGFDVHLNRWKVTIMTEELTHKTFSQDPKPEVLVNYLTKHFPGGAYYSAYEAGFCGYWIHNSLVELGVKSIVVHAADVPTTGKEKVLKDDKRDSLKLARALRSGDLVPIYVPSIATVEDRGLVRLRAAKVQELARYKCRIKSFLYLHGIEYPESFSNSHTHWSCRFNKWLEGIEMKGSSGKATLDDLLESSNHLRAAILKVTKQIRVLSRTDSYKVRQELLRTIPGISYITAMTILTEIETISRFANFDKLCGYIGLTPSTNSSGEKEKIGNLTPRGHTLRSVIIESAWVAARLDPALCKSYHDYCIRMEPNKAIIRIARKLLNRIMYVLKNNKPYVCSIVK
jgi:transposase